MSNYLPLSYNSYMHRRLLKLFIFKGKKTYAENLFFFVHKNIRIYSGISMEAFFFFFFPIKRTIILFSLFYKKQYHFLGRKKKRPEPELLFSPIPYKNKFEFPIKLFRTSYSEVYSNPEVSHSLILFKIIHDFYTKKSDLFKTYILKYKALIVLTRDREKKKKELNLLASTSLEKKIKLR